MCSKSLRIRYWAHKARNILDKVPEYARSEVKAYLQTIFVKLLPSKPGT
jgi:transposase-like protein